MTIEPTRAIAEVRTIVTGARALEKLTYVDEMGGWQVPSDATGANGGAQTYVDLDMPDVPIDLFASPSLDFGLATGAILNRNAAYRNGAVFSANAAGVDYMDVIVLNADGSVGKEHASRRGPIRLP